MDKDSLILIGSGIYIAGVIFGMGYYLIRQANEEYKQYIEEFEMYIDVIKQKDSFYYWVREFAKKDLKKYTESAEKDSFFASKKLKIALKESRLKLEALLN